MTDEQSGAPARIMLDDLAESVTRGVMRALESEGEVAGYAMPGQFMPASPMLPGGRLPGGPIIVGLIFYPQQLPGGGFDLPQ